MKLNLKEIEARVDSFPLRTDGKIAEWAKEDMPAMLDWIHRVLSLIDEPCCWNNGEHGLCDCWECRAELLLSELEDLP